MKWYHTRPTDLMNKIQNVKPYNHHQFFIDHAIFLARNADVILNFVHLLASFDARTFRFLTLRQRFKQDPGMDGVI
jgi:hypothetical protein